jgi:hypothetical protein
MINRKNIIVIAIMAIMLMGSVVLSAANKVYGRVYDHTMGRTGYVSAYVITPEGYELYLGSDSIEVEDNGYYTIDVDDPIPQNYPVKVTCLPDADNVLRIKYAQANSGGDVNCDFYIQIQSSN